MCVWILLRRLVSAALDAVALNPGPMLTYFTGLHFHLMERPTVLLAMPGQLRNEVTAALILPELEMQKVQTGPIRLQTFTYGDNPATWAQAFANAAQTLNLSGAAALNVNGYHTSLTVVAAGGFSTASAH